MKNPCKICVKSSRLYSAMDFLPPFSRFEDEEMSEEDLWMESWADEEEGLEETNLASRTDLPSDRFGKATPIPPSPPITAATFTVFGVFSKEKDGSFRISYQDAENTGSKGSLTTFCLSPTGMLILLRRGDGRTCMAFEKGHRHLCDYGAAAGLPSLVLHTHSLDASLTESGGKITVDYSVEIRGIKSEHNRLAIEITPA